MVYFIKTAICTICI